MKMKITVDLDRITCCDDESVTDAIQDAVKREITTKVTELIFKSPDFKAAVEKRRAEILGNLDAVMRKVSL